MSKLYAGVDEAGRGPVIGPLVLAYASFDKPALKQLSNLKVRDSKRLSVDRRNHLYPLICELATEYHIAYIEPAEIDSLRKKISLNEIEAQYTAKIFGGLKFPPKKITVDAADSVADNYRKRIASALKNDFSFQLVCEHKADDNYVEVSAASVIAKVSRDNAIEELKMEYGDFGSGYPCDPLTTAYIHKLIRSGRLPDYVRKSWNTVSDKKQTILGEH